MRRAIAVAAAGLVLLVTAGCNMEPSEKAKENIGQVQMGMTGSEVKELLGEPESTQHMENEFMGSTSTEDCWYYGVVSYQLCFTNGRLTAKNLY